MARRQRQAARACRRTARRPRRITPHRRVRPTVRRPLPSTARPPRPPRTDVHVRRSPGSPMAACTYTYLEAHAACPHPATSEGGLCLWHNRLVSKSDAYVRGLLTQADALGQTDLSEFHLAGLQWPGAHLPLRRLTRADL